MIITKLLGGLGNQLFQYAIGRKLSIIHNTELKIHKESFGMYQLRRYGLGNFNIKATEATEEEVQKILSQNGNYGIEKERKFLPEILESPDNIYLRGDWQSELYFDDIADVLREEFTLKSPLDKKADKWAKKIKNSKGSVSLHIRRGDYLKNPILRKNFGVLPKEYYQNAINIIKEKIKNIKIFVFSDDISYVRNNLKLDAPVTYVEGVKSDYEELYLMSLCENHIIANSSFSWWGAWLDPNPDKIVIAPNPWFRLPIGNTDIVPKNWLTAPSALDTTKPEKPVNTFITAIINITDNEKNLEYVLKSILFQNSIDSDDLEIIAVLNAPKDNSANIAETLLKNRENTQYMRLQNRISAGAAYNLALPYAKGEYITFFNSFDMIESNSVMNACHFVDAFQGDIIHPSIWYALDDSGNIGIAGRKYKAFADSANVQSEQIPDNFDIRLQLLLKGNINDSLTGKIFRKAWLTEKNLKFNENLICGENIEFILCALGLGAKYVKVPLGARIAGNVDFSNKDKWQEAFRAFLQVMNVRINANDKAQKEQIMNSFAILYIREYIQPLFASDEVLSAVKQACEIAGEYGVNVKVKTEATQHNINNNPRIQSQDVLKQTVENCFKEATKRGNFNVDLLKSYMEPVFKQEGFREDINEIKSVLVIRFDAIGDSVLTSGFLRELRKNYPKAFVTLVVNPTVAPLVELCPYVNEVISSNVPYIRDTMTRFEEILKLCYTSLWKRKYDIAFLPRWDDDLPYFAKFLAYFSGARERVAYGSNVYEIKQQNEAFLDELMTVNVIAPNDVVNEAEKNYYFLKANNLRVEDDSLELWYSNHEKIKMKRILNKFSKGRKIIAVVIGANAPFRIYPPEKMAIALNKIKDENNCFAIFGGQSDKERGELIRQKLADNALINLAGCMSIRETAAAFSLCSMYIGMDTGPMHIAVAANLPVIEISCCPSNLGANPLLHVNRFTPLTTPTILLQPKKALPPCGEQFSFSGCVNLSGAHCISQIEPDEIVKAYEKLSESWV